jgi:hypothetical protein
MKKTLWVVYEIGAAEKAQGMNVVCEQDEWDALELAQPGKQPAPLRSPAHACAR